MKSSYKTVEVEVDLEDFDTEDLVMELEDRGYTVQDAVSAPDVYELFELKRINSPLFEAKFNDFIYARIGRIL